MFEKLKSKKDEIVAIFEDNTGIRGLEFKLMEGRRWNNQPCFSYEANVPENRLGILANNFHDVRVVIDITNTETEIFLKASFQYSHDIGSNGIDILNADTKSRFNVRISL